MKKAHRSDALINFVIENLPDSIALRKALLRSALDSISTHCERRVMLVTLLQSCERMERDQLQFLALITSSGNGGEAKGSK